jgi:hypothetical protein
MSDPFSPKRKTLRLEKQNLFGSGYAGLGTGREQLPGLPESCYQAGCQESSTKEGRMDAYPPEIERVMKRLFDSLGEKDRRRYAAVEATKLGHGGIEYIARLLGCDPKTIRQGQSELEGTDELNSGRVRKKGVGGNG